jgi:menaquinone-dependent protoporphyrinogen IX oxidase
MYDAFGGVIDFSRSSKMGWLDKKIIGIASKDDSAIKKNKRNDWRDWNQITAFGEKFAELLRKKLKQKDVEPRG